MTVKDAVVKRFEQLCDQRGIRPNELANLSGGTPSTVYSMLNPARQRISIATIKKLCDGLEIPLGQFFSCTLFDDLDQELQVPSSIMRKFIYKSGRTQSAQGRETCP